MKISALKYQVLMWASSLTILIILLMPFHAFLTVWAASAVDYYTALRLWKEVLLVVLAGLAVFLILTDHKIRFHTLSRRLVWLILLYTIVTATWGLLAYRDNQVTASALGHGLVVNLRFLAFFLITWAISLRVSRLRTHWQWITLWPAAIVVIFGILQFLVLPKDFLVNFGYSEATIAPYETINNNENYVRVASTLRGANPLGAYLIIPISMLAVLLLKNILQRRQMALLVATLVCLLFSFSRSAWLGALIALAVILVVIFKTPRARKIMGAALIGLVLLGAGSLALLRQNDHFENLVFHTQEESTIETSSNDARYTALQTGSEEVLRDPIGDGTGTAGPASVHNGNCSAKISENYFIQIGQETGWIGLGLFLLINIGVGYLLWMRRADPLALSLFAALIGLTFVNLLSHAWTDDTLAYIWWGLAGIAMAPNLIEERKDAETKANKKRK